MVTSIIPASGDQIATYERPDDAHIDRAAAAHSAELKGDASGLPRWKPDGYKA